MGQVGGDVGCGREGKDAGGELDGHLDGLRRGNWAGVYGFDGAVHRGTPWVVFGQSLVREGVRS